MAEQGYVLDIDARFLANLKKADESLAKTAKQVELLTKSFENTLSRSSAFAVQMQKVYSDLAVIGGADFSSGMAKVDTTARNAVDAVNLLTHNVVKLKQEYNSMAADWNGSKAKGTHLRITSDADLENVAKLKHAIKQINETLNNRKRKKPLSLVDVESLIRQKDLYKRAVKELMSTDKSRTSSVVIETNKRLREMKREVKLTQEMADAKYTASPKAAMSYATQAKSINQMSKALKYLETVRDNINTKTKTGAANVVKINALIAELSGKVKRLKGKVASVGDEMKRTEGAASKFGNIMKGVLSIQAIRGYINQLISVRGEMELQQRSLQAILKDKGEANKVWQQTIRLAVKSPFQIKEMVTYTKQLAAYRVESEKLVETNKMLADISAGLGVDMSRLILAYGQVKAANYLRGTELRQFSEAGINILDELAAHFTALEGTTVSVGEVFERVSKRMVSFEDVETVLKKVTAAGGTFYRMQEIQSETLRGQISNLKDSITVMLNDIGKANDGVMKTGVAFARTLIEHWEEVAVALKAALVVMTAVKINSMLASRSLIALALKMKVITGEIPKTLTLGQGLTTIFKKAGTSISGAAAAALKFAAVNPVLTAISVGVAGIISAVIEFSRISGKISDIKDKYKDLNEVIRDLSISFRQGFEKDSLDDAKKDLASLIEVANRDYKLNIDTQIPDNIDLAGLEAQFISVREQIFDAKEFAKEVEIEFAKREGFFSNLFVGSGRDPIEQVREFGEEAEEVFTILRDETKDVANAIQTAGFYLTTQQKAALEDILKPMGTEETKIAYIKRIDNAYKELKDIIKLSGVEVTNFIRLLELSNGTALNTSKVFKKLEDNIKFWWSGEQKERYIKFGIDQMVLEKELSETDAQILYWAANRHFNVNITPVFSSTAGNKALASWQEQYNKMIKGVEGFKEISNPEKTRDDLIDDLTSILTENQKTLNRIEQIGVDEATSETGAYKGVDVEDLKKKAAKAQELLDWLQGKVVETDNKMIKSQKDWVGEVIKSVRDAHKEYTSLVKDLDVASAKMLALERTQEVFNEAISHVEAFKGINLGNITFETEEGAIGALTMLKRLLPETAYESRLAIEKAIGDIRGELNIAESKSSTEKLKTEIENMFSGYQLFIELGELNIPKDWAKSFFDIEAFDLSEIKNKIINNIEDIQATGGHDERLKILQDFLNRVNQMEQKAQHDRLKTYLQYARDAIGERAKIKLEELKKLQEIEMTFGAKETPEKAGAISHVQEESYQAARKLDWEEFQKSDTFINLFKDLDSASTALTEHMIEKLRNFKDEWRNMPIEDMRAIVDKINQLESQLIKSNPYAAIKALKDERSEDARSDSQIQADSIIEAEKIAAYDDQIAKLQVMLRLKEEGRVNDELSYADAEALFEVVGWTTEETRDQITALQGSKSASEAILSNNQNTLNVSKNIRAAYAAQAEYLQRGQKMANDLYDAFSDLADILWGSDSPGAVFAQMGMDMANSVMNCFALQLQLKSATVEANTFAAAMNTAMGVVGWIVMAVELISAGLKTVFEVKDKSLERNIERIQADVNKLEKSYQRLEKAMDDAFSTEQLEAYYDLMSKNIDQQIASYEAMRKLEEDKKKTDQSKLDEYDEAIDKLKESRRDLNEEVSSKASGGILDDALSAAEGFVDAWLEAFRETGDGISGLESEFKDMMTNLMKKQAAMQIVGAYTNMYSSWLKDYINPDGGDVNLTAEEAREWAEKVKSTFPELSAALEAFFSGTQDLMQEQGELSELSKGIQGVTESTAQVLEALLNSMRFYVADSNTQLKNIAAAFASNDVEQNPLLNELRQQTALVRSIESMFDSVIGRGGSSHNGPYLKVSI